MCTNVSGTDHFAAKFNGATFASALSTLTSGVGRDDDTMSGAATEGRNGCSLWVRVKIGTRQRHCATVLLSYRRSTDVHHTRDTDMDSSDGDVSGGNTKPGPTDPSSEGRRHGSHDPRL